MINQKSQPTNASLWKTIATLATLQFLISDPEPGHNRSALAAYSHPARALVGRSFPLAEMRAVECSWGRRLSRNYRQGLREERPVPGAKEFLFTKTCRVAPLVHTRNPRKKLTCMLSSPGLSRFPPCFVLSIFGHLLSDQVQTVRPPGFKPYLILRPGPITCKPQESLSYRAGSIPVFAGKPLWI